MARREIEETFKLSRRDFLITTGGALAGMAAFGLVDASGCWQAPSATGRHPALWPAHRCCRPRLAYSKSEPLSTRPQPRCITA